MTNEELAALVQSLSEEISSLKEKNNDLEKLAVSGAYQAVTQRRIKRHRDMCNLAGSKLFKLSPPDPRIPDDESDSESDSQITHSYSTSQLDIIS